MTEPIDPRTLTVGVLGGTGAQGKGLALRWAQAGIRVIVGSRAVERAESAAAQYRELTGVDHITGADNATTAADADIVIATLPWTSHAETLDELAEPLRGKIFVDCVNPLGFDDKGPYPLMVPEGSAAQQAEQLLPGSRVTAAFHTVSAVMLADLDRDEVDCDVLVLGDDREATDAVRALATAIPGVRGLYAGRLRNAHQVECLTANLIAINRRNKVHAAVKIVWPEEH